MEYSEGQVEMPCLIQLNKPQMWLDDTLNTISYENLYDSIPNGCNIFRDEPTGILTSKLAIYREFWMLHELYSYDKLLVGGLSTLQ